MTKPLSHLRVFCVPYWLTWTRVSLHLVFAAVSWNTLSRRSGCDRGPGLQGHGRSGPNRRLLGGGTSSCKLLPFPRPATVSALQACHSLPRVSQAPGRGPSDALGQSSLHALRGSVLCAWELPFQCPGRTEQVCWEEPRPIMVQALIWPSPEEL